LLRSRAGSRLYLFSIALPLGFLMAAITWSIIGPWDDLGTFWPSLFLLAFIAILAYRLWHGLPARWLPQRRSREIWLTGLNVLHAMYWALWIPLLLQARNYEGEAFDIAPPLRGGTFHLNGAGANFLVNQHAFEAVSRYAMDITQLNRFGMAGAGIYPRELDKYVIFGAEIVAPCAGEVIAAEDGLPNRRPLDPDGDDTRGANHVVLFCQGHSLHLAHMDNGSVAVEVGERVVTGQLLGRVGNSGNSMQPHLHIGAVRGRYTDIRKAVEAGDPVVSAPLLIDGKFLVRGDSFTN
jgi:hypothetical protein